ncbi:MAG: YcaO-like family protein [Roseobacter sp.]|jgi:ribosomal protein S12 methylthiotransferase accessory factor|nr:YcaO-like family protein [Roseobacter sp.]
MHQHSEALKDARFFDLERDKSCPIYVSAAQIHSGNPTRRRVVSGWGETREAARQKCLWEAKERACALWSDAITQCIAPFCDLPAHTPDPRKTVLLSALQYDARNAWNSMVDAPHHHPAPFSPQQPVAWVKGRTVYGGEPVQVAAGQVFLGYPRAIAEGFPVTDSNGLAAGASPADAASRALLELVERDAVSIWWYNRIRAPEAAGTTTRLTDAYTAWEKSRRRKLTFLDLTTDLGVPVVAAVACEEPRRDISIGFGAGWSTAAAAESAVGELAQFDITKRLRRASGTKAHPWSFLAVLAGLGRKSGYFLDPCKSRPTAPARSTTTETLREKLISQDIPPVLVDLSNENTAVVRVVAPGLRPIWPRFAPGRLYDVPVAMTVQTEKTLETELNPMPILY